MASRGRPSVKRLSLPVAMAAALLLSACNPQQSALHPAGQEAAEVATLFWAMTIGGAIVWAIVMGIAIYAVVGKRRPKSERFADRFVLIGGVAFPTVVLAALLVFGLSLLPSWTQDEEPDLRIHVSAEQFWWRIGYELPGGARVETANEVHLPLGTTEFVLTSPDVIHSFWIPALGGKMDAIPGRTTVLRLTATKPGLYRGACAEFCGPSHALMAFPVEVHEPEAFAAWLEGETASASGDPSPFVRAGCAGCHTIRGLSEAGSLGPDLTHLASRKTLAAGTLEMSPEALRAWLMDPDATKPWAHMPGFAMLPEAEVDALVAFLMELR